MPYTLVVIDMQPESFSAARKRDTVANIIREIRKANKSNAYVLLVQYSEYGGHTLGPIDKRIIRETKKLPDSNVKTVSKTKDDGSLEVITALDKYGYPKDFLRVCGVNTDACVQRTVVGLDEKLNNYGFDGFKVDRKKDEAIIEIVWDACNTDTPYGLKGHDLTRHCSENVVIVNLA